MLRPPSLRTPWTTPESRVSFLPPCPTHFATGGTSLTRHARTATTRQASSRTAAPTHGGRASPRLVGRGDRALLAARPPSAAPGLAPRPVGALGFGQPPSDALDAMGVARVVAEELRRLFSLRRAQHPFPERERLARVVARSRHVDQPDMVRFGFLLAAERKRGAFVQQREDADVLGGCEGDAAGDDRGGDLG